MRHHHRSIASLPDGMPRRRKTKRELHAENPEKDFTPPVAKVPRPAPPINTEGGKMKTAPKKKAPQWGMEERTEKQSTPMDAVKAKKAKKKKV